MSDTVFVVQYAYERYTHVKYETSTYQLCFIIYEHD